MIELTAKQRFKGSRQVEHIDTSNMNTLHNLMNPHQEFVVLVEIYVVVERKKRLIRYYVNLLKPSSIFVGLFLSTES